MNIRIFTSSYDDCKVGNLISISGDKGRRAGFKGKAISELAPKRNFWEKWHNNIGKISEEENTKYYIKEYYDKVLSKVNIEDLLKHEKDPVLLCYERGQEFCHRHVLAEYIEMVYGIKVRDIKVDNNLNIEENKRPEYIKKILKEIMSLELEK